MVSVFLTSDLVTCGWMEGARVAWLREVGTVSQEWFPPYCVSITWLGNCDKFPAVGQVGLVHNPAHTQEIGISCCSSCCSREFISCFTGAVGESETIINSSLYSENWFRLNLDFRERARGCGFSVLVILFSGFRNSKWSRK